MDMSSISEWAFISHLSHSGKSTNSTAEANQLMYASDAAMHREIHTGKNAKTTEQNTRPLQIRIGKKIQEL